MDSEATQVVSEKCGLANPLLVDDSGGPTSDSPDLVHPVHGVGAHMMADGWVVIDWCAEGGIEGGLRVPPSWARTLGKRLLSLTRLKPRLRHRNATMKRGLVVRQACCTGELREPCVNPGLAGEASAAGNPDRLATATVVRPRTGGPEPA
jgi:hypothetical protein